MSQWTSRDLASLRRLRERFIAGTAGRRDYWETDEELALYDATFAERIGWKWDAVLAELVARDWRPQSRHVLDWGCGSGVAGRRVLAQWPHLGSLSLHDRSGRAMRFAAQRAKTDFPNVAISSAMMQPDTLLVLSHVLNELPEPELALLLTLVRQAREVLWVEAGTHADSRRLITAVREELRGEFAVVAPCTHRAECGLLASANAHHWCHHFAAPPPWIFQDARWIEFGRDLNIDLRALPYSFLALDRVTITPPGLSRVIGRPREAKGFTKVLNCREDGAREWMLQKRDAPDIFRAFHKGSAHRVYRWTTEADRITAGEPFA